MKLAIDASNIRSGGGLTHLRCLLEAAEPAAQGISEVSVWGGADTLKRLPERPWLAKVHEAMLDRALPWRVFWQQAILPGAAARRDCGVLFSPGGTVPARAGMPTVTVSQNMLPFEPEEAARFGRCSPMWLKLKLLRSAQGHSFRRADGMIFLTEYARRKIGRQLPRLPRKQAVIPHGIEERFRLAPRPQARAEEFTPERPFRVLYVSIVDAYKHQLAVAEAVAEMRRDGLPVALEFIGPERPPYGDALRDTLSRADPAGGSLRWSRGRPHEELHLDYHRADAFVFASSCENLPNILLEAMAAGLPIASSDRGPMPEVLGEAGVYFDPESSREIGAALRRLLTDRELRQSLAGAAYERARPYSWKRCADDTLAFIAEVARASRSR